MGRIAGTLGFIFGISLGCAGIWYLFGDKIKENLLSGDEISASNYSRPHRTGDTYRSTPSQRIVHVDVALPVTVDPRTGDFLEVPNTASNGTRTLKVCPTNDITVKLDLAPRDPLDPTGRRTLSPSYRIECP